MRVLYDLRGNQSRHFAERGIPRYIGHHVAALAARREVTELHGVVDPLRPLPRVLAQLAHKGWALPPEAVGSLLNGGEPLIHHVSSPFELDLSREDLIPRPLRAREVARVVTLYDVIPLAYPREFGWVQRMWEARADLLRTADMVVAISEYTAADAVSRLGLDESRMRVISTGVPAVSPVALAGAAAWPPVSGLNPGYVLYTGGTNDERKNLPRLVRAYAQLDSAIRDAHQLVIASKVEPRDRLELEAEAAAHGVADRLLLTGYVSDEDLHRLFRNCACFVYPSLYEGFGLPIVEAMSFGAAVVASNTTACGEISVDPRAGFNPADEADIARVLTHVLTDHELADALRRQGPEVAAKYHWKAVAERTVEAYVDALSHLGRRPARRKETGPRLVFASASFPDGDEPAGWLLALARAASRISPVRYLNPFPIQHGDAGFSVGPLTDMHRSVVDGGDTPVLLIDSEHAAQQAAHWLEQYGGVAVVWELDRVLGVPGADDEQSQARLAVLHRIMAAANVVAVQSALDAVRMRALAGGAYPLAPTILEPPLAWSATDGGPGHQLAWELGPILGPGRAVARLIRPQRLVIAARHPRFGPFTDAEVTELGEIARGLRRSGLPLQVVAIGSAGEQAIEAALGRSSVGRRPRTLEFVEWPNYLELVKWVTAAGAFLDLADASPAAQSDSIDRALLAARPIVTLGEAGECGALVHRLRRGATPFEVIERLPALAIEPDAERPGEALRRRHPANVAARLHALVTGAPALGGQPTIPERL